MLGSRVLSDAGLVEVWSPGPLPGTVWAAPVDGGLMVAVDGAGRVVLTQAEAMRRDVWARAALEGSAWLELRPASLVVLHLARDCQDRADDVDGRPYELRRVSDGLLQRWDLADALRRGATPAGCQDLAVCGCAGGPR